MKSFFRNVYTYKYSNTYVQSNNKHSIILHALSKESSFVSSFSILRIAYIVETPRNKNVPVVFCVNEGKTFDMQAIHIQDIVFPIFVRILP